VEEIPLGAKKTNEICGDADTLPNPLEISALMHWNFCGFKKLSDELDGIIFRPKKKT